MKISPRNVFRLDGFGAMVSLLFHLIIAFNQPTFGMPKQVVFYLSIFPTLLMPFSLYHSLHLPQNWKPSLRTIIIGNLLFCFVSIGVIAYYIDSLTILGLVYFIGEVIVVLGLVALVELRVLQKET